MRDILFHHATAMSQQIGARSQSVYVTERKKTREAFGVRRLDAALDEGRSAAE